MKLRSVFFALLAVLGLSLVIAASATAKAVPVGATSFQSNGSQENGWYWVRSSGQSATFTFPVSALQTVKPGSTYLNVSALVTNTVNGGSGYGAHIKLAISNGTRTGSIPVSLTNPFRPIDPQNSGGVGYQAYGSAYVSSVYLKGAQSITLTYTFPTGLSASALARVAHVAFNQGAITLAYSTLAV